MNRSEPEATGFERWLRSPIRAALLAAAAVVAAATATFLGEAELANEGLGLFVGASIALARRGVSWAWIGLLHLPAAVVCASGFLVAEIHLLEIAQGPEETEYLKGAVTWMERAIQERRQAEAEGREPRDGRGRRGRDGDERSEGRPPPEDPRDAARTGPLRAPNSASSPDDRVAADGTTKEGTTTDRPTAGSEPGGLQERSAEDPVEAGTRAPNDERRGTESSWRRSMRDRSGRGPSMRRFGTGPPAINVATGDVSADFDRRWKLRVPRYALVYFALLGIGLGIRAYLTGRTREREAESLRLRASALEADLNAARLAALKGQLHPHFLFNALHSVGGLVRANRGPEALTALDSIGDLLRTSLDADPQQFVPLEREMELIERYLAVESLRLGDRLRITIEIPDELREAEVPAFIAQPLVENAIKHGVAEQARGGHVRIRAFTEGDATLVIEVTDDGPGLGRAATDPSRQGRGGIGLAHIRGRLDALFAGTGSLELVERTVGGVRATLRLPLEDIDI